MSCLAFFIIFSLWSFFIQFSIHVVVLSAKVIWIKFSSKIFLYVCLWIAIKLFYYDQNTFHLLYSFIH